MTRFQAAAAEGEHWGLAAKSCLQQLGPLSPGANLGFVYVTEGFAEALSSIIVFLHETTSIECWIGGVGHGIFGPMGEYRGPHALTVMIGAVDASAVSAFPAFDRADQTAFLAEQSAWLAGQPAVAALVHGDPATPGIVDALVQLSTTARAFLVGGLTVSGCRQVCGRPVEAAMSGLLIGEGMALATGLTQGCSPLGPRHRVSEAVNNVIMRLDGVPAVQALKAEAGDPIAGDLKRAAGYIHVGRPVAGSDTSDYVVHGLLGIDPTHGWLAIDSAIPVGDEIFFVKRDAAEARRDLQRMLEGLARRLAGRTIRGGLYISCVARMALFDEEECESEMIRRILGDFPLIGFSAGGEICHDRLYSFTGVLMLFV